MNIERTKAVVTIVITALVNIANVYGYAVDAEMWVNAALSVLSAVTVLWSWWFNQNITEEAQAAQLVLNKLKNEKRAVKLKERDA